MLQLKEETPPLETVDCCLRKSKKIVSTGEIISCPLAKLSSLFEKCFSRISVTVSTSRKINLIKKHLRENSFQLAE